jgi:DegV family protein with EDD domain
VQICISSEFSACYLNACLAAESFENVYVVDSRNLSTGLGYHVLNAAEMAEKGMAAADIKAAIDKSVSLMDASFVINTLEYLHKGGRCSGLQALSAMLFSIKPCIEVKNGKMNVGRKYRGKLEQCIEKYVRDKLENNGNIDRKRIFITHTATAEHARIAREAILKYTEFDEILETTAGCAISNHCGPNTLGILFMRKATEE